MSIRAHAVIPAKAQWHEVKVRMRKTPHERSSILVILSEPHGVSGGTSGGGERRTPVASTRAWVDRHTRVVTDFLCFRATSQGSFARPLCILMRQLGVPRSG